MKTIFPALLAVFSSALLLRLMPLEIKANEVLPPEAAVEGNKTSTPAQSGSLSKSGGSNGRGPGNAEDSRKPSYVSQKAKSGRSISRSEQANQEVPPVFQVSPDPRDQVQFLVNNGIVTVQGSVGTRELARKLIRKYSRMPGVRQVRNRLTVRTNDDAKIAVQLREALSHAPDTRAGGIAVTVYDGIVFLSGAVSSAQESGRAEKLAQDLQGVKRVNNRLRLPGQSRYPVRVPSQARSYTRR
jgi:osmotically-inducible protein OsmY